MSVPSVRIQGSRTTQSAFASINRQWWTVLGQRRDVSLVDDEDGSIADVAVHHDFAVRFGEVAACGRRRVAVRPWDFGPYPPRWVSALRTGYDELWVHSTWSALGATTGGVEPERVRRIPLGVDPDEMRPDGPRADLGLGDRFVFAFVGAAVHRKGIDILLEAFRRAFGPGDDVALVIKDHTRDVFYRRQSYREQVLAAASDPGGAPIVYIDEYLPAPALAAIYRRADAFVLPYRAEGFACPVLEAMACGTPPIIPDFGPCLDYCDATTGILVPTRQVKLPIGRTLPTNSLAFDEHIEAVHFCETPVERLADALVATARRPPAELAALGAAAAERARAWTWAVSVDAVVDGIRELMRR